LRSCRAVLAAGFIGIGLACGYLSPQRHLRAEHDLMTDTLPDRLSANPKSPHHDAALLERGVGIRFNGIEKTNVEEYCVSEGWVRVTAGTAKDRAGNPMTVKLKGKVEPYLRAPEPEASQVTPPDPA
jgi:hypothetical protein